MVYRMHTGYIYLYLQVQHIGVDRKSMLRDGSGPQVSDKPPNVELLYSLIAPKYNKIIKSYLKSSIEY